MPDPSPPLSTWLLALLLWLWGWGLQGALWAWTLGRPLAPSVVVAAALGLIVQGISCAATTEVGGLLGCLAGALARTGGHMRDRDSAAARHGLARQLEAAAELLREGADAQAVELIADAHAESRRLRLRAAEDVRRRLAELRQTRGEQ